MLHKLKGVMVEFFDRSLMMRMHKERMGGEFKE